MLDLMRKPDLYELLYRDETQDLPAYIKFIKRASAQEVIEWGSGTGRVAFALAANNVNVLRVDASQEMANYATSALQQQIGLKGTVSFETGSMQDYNPGSLKDAALICFGTINFLLDKSQLLKALRNIKRSIKTSGGLLIEFNTPNTYELDVIPKGFRAWKERRSHPLEEGITFQVDVESQYDGENEILTQERKFQFYNARGELTEQSTHSWKNWIMPEEEIRNALIEVGFSEVRSYGDYEFSKPYQTSSQVGIITCRC